MIPVNTAITARFGLAGLKASLDMVGYYGGAVRLPRLGVSESDREALQGILARAGVLQEAGG